jgi:hypothetical protein
MLSDGHGASVWLQPAAEILKNQPISRSARRTIVKQCIDRRDTHGANGSAGKKSEKSPSIRIHDYPIADL